MPAQIELSRKQLLSAVSSATVYRSVNEKSFYRWLKDLKFEPPFGPDHLAAVTYYADRLALGVTASKALTMTLEYMENRSNE